MYKFFVSTVAVMIVALVTVRADDAKEDKEPSNDIAVNVQIPKTFKVTDTKIAGGQTGGFVLKFEITNKTDKVVAFSQSQVKVKMKGVMENMISVGKGLDATPIEPGKTLKTERTVSLNTLVPDDGQQFDIEVTIRGHKTKGKITAKK